MTEFDVNAFMDELYKAADWKTKALELAKHYGQRGWDATVGSLGKGVSRAGELIQAPIETTRKGWQSFGKGKATETLKEIYKKHGKKGLAKELSRRGWTGSGRITKYLPVGDKALVTGFTGHGLYQTATGPREDVGKNLGSTALGNLAWVAGGAGRRGLPLLGSLGLLMGGSMAGEAVGGVYDKIRSAKRRTQAPYQLGAVTRTNVPAMTAAQTMQRVPVRFARNPGYTQRQYG